MNPNNDGDDSDSEEEQDANFLNFLKSSSSGKKLSEDEFKLHLKNYPAYIREVYQDLEKARFSDIGVELSSRKVKYLTLDELKKMDRWMQKRGTPLNKEVHQLNERKIAANTADTVKRSTNRAFQRYHYRKGNDWEKRTSKSPQEGKRTAEDALEAMKILQNGLEGVARDRASLLLSIAFPEDIPYLSRALYMWLNFDPKTEEAQQIKWNKTTCAKLLKDVKTMAETFKVKAVDVEKVAFVLESEGRIAAFKDTRIRAKLLKDKKNSEEKGSGANGRVYQVSASKAGFGNGFVAIKKIYKTPHVQIARGRFLSEIEISGRLTKLSPKRFVEFYGWNETDSKLLIAMEFISNGDLENSLTDCPKDWTERAIRIATEQILEALRFMHDASIAHRDLKPQNILVVSQPSDVEIKVADFGVSKRLSDRKTTAFRTATGTTGYRAPEVVEAWDMGTDTYTFNVDIWSLGCIIYRMAKGQSLFRTDNETMKPDKLVQKVNSIDEALRPRARGQKKHLSATGTSFVRQLVVINAKNRPDAVKATEILEEWRAR